MIYIANDNWNPTNQNPYIPDGTYGSTWSSFIYDQTINITTNVYDNAKVYVVRVSPESDMAFTRLFDFLYYEESYGRNVILKLTPGMYAADILNRYSNANHNVVYRDTDVPFMVHSTTLANWSSIQHDGSIVSPNMLRQMGKPVSEIGLKQLMEPEDYSDYVMLDIPNGCGEIVVNSRQLGYICLDPNALYNPGVRLYFDVKQIISDKIAVRDGLHILKIKDMLPLNKYLIAAITAKDFPSNIDWTPTLFTEMANQYFTTMK